MDWLSAKELINAKVGYMTDVNEIVMNFKRKIKRTIPRREVENIRKLAKIFR